MIEKDMKIEKAQLRDLPIYEVPEAGCVDMDATLIDPNLAMEGVYQVAEEFSLDVEKVRTAYQASKKGGSFSPLNLIEPDLDTEEQKKFVTRYIESDYPVLVYEDTLPFLYYADSHDYPLHLLTYGVSRPWQETKFARAHLPVANSIINHQDKGSEIESWENGGTYDFVALQQDIPVAIVKAHAVSEIDDKPDGYEKRNKPLPKFLMQRLGYEKSADNHITVLEYPGAATDLIHGVKELAIVNGLLIKGQRETGIRSHTGKIKPYTKYIPMNRIAA
jgi:hypothetical protein